MPGLAPEPALSLDGSLVAYASDAGGAGGFDLWEQRVAGGTPQRLTFDPATIASRISHPTAQLSLFDRIDPAAASSWDARAQRRCPPARG